MGVPSQPTAKPWRSTSVRRSSPKDVPWLPESLLGGAALVVFAREFIDGRVLHDVLAGELPGLLDDPRERTVLSGRFVLDFLQHLLGKVQALFTLVAAGHGASAYRVEEVLDYRTGRIAEVSSALGRITELAVRLWRHPQVGTERAPALWEAGLGVLVTHCRNDDAVVAVLPV